MCASGDVRAHSFENPSSSRPMIHRSIIRSLEALNTCTAGSRGLLDRARLLLRWDTVLNDVKQCRNDMKATLDMFNSEFTAIKRSRRATDGTERLVLLPPPPPTFHGRAREVAYVVEIVLDKAPARVAILGSGGIGKTSTALAVLHHPQIKAKYDDRRFFVSCHRVSSADGTVLELLTFFGTLEYESSQWTTLSQDELVWYLRHLQSNGILCLDDWNSDVTTNANKDLLSELASLPNITLLVTMRGTEYPKHVAWTNPLLPPLSPLTLDDAMRIWDGICETNDEHAVKLVQAVNRAPLAITLLANIARTESPKSLWQRWELNQSDPSQVDGAKSHSLSEIDLSIEFSLRGLDESAAVLLLSVICSLPQGLPEFRIPAFIDAFKDLRACVTLLKHRSLVYASEDGFLRALSPVTRYMRSYHPLPDLVYKQLTELYLKIVETDFEEDVSASAVYARDHIGVEVGNILAVLMHCVEHETAKDPLERCLLAIASFTRFCAHIHYYGIDLLDKAIDRAKDSAPAVIVELLMVKAGNLCLSARFGEATLTVMRMHEVCRSDVTKVTTAFEGWILARLGDVYYWNGQYGEAKEVLHSALKFFEKDLETKVHTITAMCNLYLGRVYLDLGILDRAEEYLQSAHRIYLACTAEAQSGSADSSCTLGELHIATSEFEKAETELLYGLEVFENRAGSEVSRAGCLQSLGCLYMRTSRLESAKERFESALELYSAAGERRGVADSLGSLGALHIQLDELGVAEEYLQSAMNLHSEAEYPRGKVAVLNSLGTLHHVLSRFDEACGILNSAVQLAASMPYPIGEGEALLRLGKVHKDRGGGELQRALSCLQRARELFGHAQDLRRVKSVRAEMDEVTELLHVSA
ncbi:TPR-like protein [Peniophora sp. CONT]|nr:TPR-like protein [Peniophora sp. CONT]